MNKFEQLVYLECYNSDHHRLFLWLNNDDKINICRHNIEIISPFYNDTWNVDLLDCSDDAKFITSLY